MYTVTTKPFTRKCWHLLVSTVLLACIISFSAAAHQQKLAYTTISYNINTDNIEVMHRFLLHDAEHAVRKLFTKNADIITDPQTRSQFSAYMESKFHLEIFPPAPEKLQMVGHEADGRYLWIYQEMPMPETITSVAIRASVLHEIWPDQVNRVNIELGKNIDTLIFTAQSSKQSVEIKP